MEIFREFTFEAAHRLPNVPEGHKCARLHGHSYRVVIHVEGPVSEPAGWVVDFGKIKDALEYPLRMLDHHTLNYVGGLENPTAEHLAQWLWDALPLRGLSAVTVWETAHAGCTYRGDAA
jgi:6-pyruvoyltetrahydropterin/6-carboxytetrahydropterin synthase